jgi:hypothetical protein
MRVEKQERFACMRGFSTSCPGQKRIRVALELMRVTGYGNLIRGVALQQKLSKFEPVQS